MIIGIIFLLFCSSPLTLFAEGFLRSRSNSPFSFEYRNWKGDFFINWEIESTAPSNVQPKLIPWREGSFSDQFSEWLLYLDKELVFFRATFSKSNNVFGQLVQVPVERLQQNPMAPFAYGMLGVKLGIGTNFWLSSLAGFDIDISPFVEIERTRQGVFFSSEKKSMYQALIRPPSELERLDRLWPSLFWDCLNAGLVGKLSCHPFCVLCGASFSAKCRPQTAGMDLKFWNLLNSDNKQGYQMGFAYQIEVQYQLPVFTLGFGHSAYIFDAEILLKGLLVKQEGDNTVAVGDGGWLPGALVQKFSGHFLCLRYSF